MRLFEALRIAPVALLWSGLSLSALGDQLYAVALSWIAVDVFGEGAGYLRAFAALAGLLATLLVGSWADRLDQHWGMVTADLGRAGMLLVLVVVWQIAGAPTAAMLVAVILVLAVGEAMFRPALQTVLPHLVADRGLLQAANGLLDATDRSARLIGPGLIAVVASAVPMVGFFAIDAVSFLLSAAALLGIHRLRPDLPQTRLARPDSVLASILRGVRAMSAHQLMRFFLITVGPFNGAWVAVYYFVLPLMIAEQNPGGAGLAQYGFVISAYGCTNLASNLVLASRKLPENPQFMMNFGNLIVGVGILLIGLSSLLPPHWQLAGYCLSASIGAIGGPMKDLPMAVLRQTRLRAADMPSAMRAYLAASNAGTLLALAITPTLLIWLGNRPVVLLCAGVYFVVAGLGLVRFRHFVDRPVTAL